MVKRKLSRPRGDIRLELFRKGVHVAVGLAVVMLLHGGILDMEILGLAALLLGAAVLYNYNYERELLLRVLSVNRPDAKVPGLDLFAYFLGMWLVVLIFPPEIARASILVVAFGDPLAHLVSRGFGGTDTMVSKDSYWMGFTAGTLAAAVAAWLYVDFWMALLASAAAMFVEAGEFRIAEHHIDDNLTIPLVAGIVLWVLQYAI